MRMIPNLFATGLVNMGLVDIFSTFVPAYSAPLGITGPKRRRTGVQYPFSSARQQARNARQMAAGQLVMAGIGRLRA